MNLELLKRLSEAPGVPGREEKIRDILRPELETLFGDVSVDVMGNLIAVKPNPGKPRLCDPPNIEGCPK